MSKPSLEELKWEGSNSRRFSFPGADHTEMKFMYPVIESDEFQFTLKIHSCRRTGFMVGVCDVDHPKKMPGSSCGWNRGAGVYGLGYSNKSVVDTFSNEDLVTVVVNRKEKTIEFLKNRLSVGKLEELEFPPGKLVIAVALCYEADFEVTEFSCGNGEEEKKTKKKEGNVQSDPSLVMVVVNELEQRFMKELREVKKENESLKEEIKLLKIKFEEKEAAGYEDLRKKNEELKSMYEDHFEKFHSTKYCIRSYISPEMTKKRNDDDGGCHYICFENDDKFHFRFQVSVENSDRSIGLEENEIRMIVNDKPFTQYKVANDSIEFEMQFTKIGRNELTFKYKSIKHSFIVDVEPFSLCANRCEILFYRGVEEEEENDDDEDEGEEEDQQVSGGGDPVPPKPVYSSSEETATDFSPKDKIQVFLKLVNDNGIPLCPRHLEGEELDVKLLKTEGKRKKKLRKILSRDRDILVDQINKKGEFFVCSIGGNVLECGTYQVKVDGSEIGEKKEFKVV